MVIDNTLPVMSNYVIVIDINLRGIDELWCDLTIIACTTTKLYKEDELNWFSLPPYAFTDYEVRKREWCGGNYTSRRREYLHDNHISRWLGGTMFTCENFRRFYIHFNALKY